MKEFIFKIYSNKNIAIMAENEDEAWDEFADFLKEKADSYELNGYFYIKEEEEKWGD